MFQRFVVQAFFLYFTALIHGFHRTQYTATLGDFIKFRQYRSFYQVRQFFDDE
ncbi:hypothetical protein D3C87_1637170 [compost metagenome]